jgi:chemotaxis protein methyltransferase WspC
MVQFRQFNLMNDFASLGMFDVVFCRNVLIYFDAPTQQRVLRTLERLLAPEGVLFVGPAEAFLARSGALSPTNHKRAFAFRKVDAPAEERRPGIAKRRSVQASRPISAARQKAAPLRIQTVPVEAPSQAAGNLEVIKRLADEGRLAEAARACEKHLRETEASAAAYYLMGLIRDAMGDERGGAGCYRKATFLEPGHRGALLHLALFAEKQGDLSAARRLKLRAQRGMEVADQ